MGSRKWSCLVCKKLADKDHKKGLIGRHLLNSMWWYDSEEEAIQHLRQEHPKEYKRAVKTGKSEEGRE